MEDFFSFSIHRPPFNKQICFNLGGQKGAACEAQSSLYLLEPFTFGSAGGSWGGPRAALDVCGDCPEESPHLPPLLSTDFFFFFLNWQNSAFSGFYLLPGKPTPFAAIQSPMGSEVAPALKEA